LHRVLRDKVIYSMAPQHPAVLEVNEGDVLTFETDDCFGSQILRPGDRFEKIGWDRINPATGPVAVKGATPGDILAVHILSIRVRNQGVMVTVPEMGVLGDRFKTSSTKLIPIKDRMAIFSETIKLPIDPMIGVIGTAPASDDVPCGTPGPHGGNLDCRMIKEGSTIYLPVAVTGAMLAMGDLHALMGDGEVLICGVEITGEVDVKLQLIKQAHYPLPLLKTPDKWYAIASAQTLDQAADMATRQMADILTKINQVSNEDAGMLMSIAGHLEVCQVVDPLKTARFSMPVSILSSLGVRMPGDK